MDQKSSQASPPTDLARIAQALTFDIDEIRASVSRPGWTPWALVATAVTAIGVLLTTIEQQQHVDTGRLIKWSIVLFVLFDVVLSRLGLPGGPQSHRQPMEGRFLHSRELRPSRRLFLCMVAQSTLLLLALWTQPLGFGSGFRLILTLIYGAEGVGALAIFALSYIGFAAPSNPAARRDESESGPPIVRILGIAIAAIYLLPSAVLMFFTVRILIVEHHDLDVVTLKAAGLILIIQLTIRFLANSVMDAPLLESFYRIRRSALLGQTTVDAALNDIEVSVAGLKASDVLQKFIRTLLRTQDELRAEARAGMDEASNFHRLLQDGEDMGAHFRNAVKARLERINALEARYKTEVVRFATRARWLSRFAFEKPEKVVGPILVQLQSGHIQIRTDWESWRHAVESAAPGMRDLFSTPPDLVF